MARTIVSRPCAFAVTVVAAALILAVPVSQTIWEGREYRAGRRDTAIPQAIDARRFVAGSAAAWTGSGPSFTRRLSALNRRLKTEIQRYEDDLEDRSIVSRFLLPPSQQILSGLLGAGNEKVYCGRDGWLFYRQSIDYAMGPGFLSPRHRARRAEEVAQPNPLKALLHFHTQLRTRGIQLVVMPVPVKPAAHPEKFSRGFHPGGEILHDPSFDEFHRELEQAGIHVMVIDSLLNRMRHSGHETYLRTDTHWRPEVVEEAARTLASYLRNRGVLPESEESGYTHAAAEIINTGDLAAMLQLPAQHGVYPAQAVQIRRVMTPDGVPWQPVRDSQVLVLGDSYANIYSLEALGWGETAGFAAQLSYYLRRPVDCILRNDSGSFATREMLRDEMARGHDRLAGKRVVVYQFSARELAFGDWKLIDLPLVPEAAGDLFCPPPGSLVTVTGTVEAVSDVPRPFSVPYRDHIFAVQLTGLQMPDGNESLGRAAVYLWSMRDNALTRATRIRLGHTITVRLRPWSDVSDTLDAVNRSELDELVLAPCWGELPE
ncbi:hypothetical protein JXA88_18610 [Candidatus Fermentibacteria bacterium]|nr:hypothetical protein [Candidatus Fermentibacteria bacterium]